MQDYGSTDVIIGINYGRFRIFKGQINPFYGSWLEYKELSPTGTEKVVIAIPTHINGIEENTTDIYCVVVSGTQFFFRNLATQSREYYYGNNANWEYVNKGKLGQNLTSPLSMNVITAIKQGEFGGVYNLNDEFIAASDGTGTGNDGALIMVTTENTTYLGGPFQEYLISDNFLNERVNDVAIGDINNDGDNDIVAPIGTYLYVFENDGTPRNGEWNYNKVDSTSRNVTSIALADLNLDGWLDIIGAVYTSGTYRIIVYNNPHNPHSQYFNPIEIKYTTTNPIKALDVGDIDNDGDTDVIVGLDNGTMIALENKLHVPIGYNSQDPFSSGPWDSKVINSKVGTSVNVLKINDLDTDGDLDIIVGYNNGEVCLYENLLPHPTDGVSVFKKEEIFKNTLTGNYLSNLALGDLDNDGDIDIAVSSYTTSSVRSNISIIQNPGYSILKNFSISHTWSPTEIYYETGQDYYQIELVDIDKDGNIDVVFNQNEQYIKGLKNDGTPFNGLWASSGSAFNLVNIGGLSVTGSRYFYLCDLDFDWKQEFIWTGSNSGTYQGNVKAFRQTTNPWNNWEMINLINFGGETPIKYALAGYFDNDNFLDLVIFDGDHRVYLVKGAASITSIGQNDYWNIWDGGSNHDVNWISLGDIGYDKRDDIILVGNLDTKSVYSLENSFQDIRNDPDWNLKLRSSFNSSIYGCTIADLTMDGASDIIFWTSNSLYIAEGNEIPDNPVPNKLISSFTNSINDVKIGDIDQDGDLDIVVATTTDVYVLYNRIRDDIYPANLTIQYGFEGYNVIINATSNETLYTNPQIHISLGSLHHYGVMVNANDPQEPLKWTYQYYITKNGNYSICINTTDLYGNFGEIYSNFVGNHPLAEVNITLLSPSPTSGYSNGSITIIITNSSLPVYTDYSPYPWGDILLNITDPNLNTEWVVATYQGGNLWNATYNNINKNGNWTIALNYTDADKIVYNYIEKSFIADITPPSIQNAYEPPLNGTIYYQIVYLNLNLTFTEPIINLWFWPSKYNPETGTDQVIGKVQSILLPSSGNITVDILYNLPPEAAGNVNLTILYRDLAGNYNSYKFNLTIMLFYPIAYDFFIRDPITGERNIKETHSRLIIIGWEAINCTHIQYSVGIGNTANWSELIDYNDFNRQNYPIYLGMKKGWYNITIRFYNYYNFVELSKEVYYKGEELPPFPWWWFVIIAIVAGVGYGIYKIITKPRERSWKEYLDEVEI